MSLDEFTLISRYFTALTPKRQDTIMGVGDDAAVLMPPPGHQLVMAMDTLVAGVHFPLQTVAYDLGYKVLAVNLSDLAAMGAEPRWILLSLTLPQVDETWLAGFSSGLKDLACIYKVQLVGGDTTRGALTITLQASGSLPLGVGLYRHGARPGDLLYVTGQLGEAGLALKMLQEEIKVPPGYQAALLQRLNRPVPRVYEGIWLRSIATAAVDISDGLAADLGHILRASQVGATVYLERLPVPPALKQSLSTEQAWHLALTAGDDYELCFTIPPLQQSYLEKEFIEKFGIHCQLIGVIEENPGLRLRAPNGANWWLEATGYQHF